jgi:hypothetical protein
MTLKTFKFDNTDGTTATTGNTGCAVVNPGGGAIKFSAAAAAQGATGLEIVTTATGQNAIARPLATASNNQMAISGVFSYLGSGTGNAPTASCALGGVRQASNDTYAVRFNINSTNGFRPVDSAGVAIQAPVTTLVPGAQYFLDMLFTGGSTTGGVVSIDLYNFSGGAVGSLIQSWNTSAANMIASPLTGLDIGMVTSNQAMTIRWDSVQMNDGATSKLGLLVPSSPPSVSAPANQNVSAGATVTATVSATDDGSIASYAWTVVSASSTSTPTLTGASTSSVSFTAPAAGNLITLQCVVTDNDGLTSSASCEVRVASSTSSVRHLAMDGTSVGTWTKAGGSATDGAALNDESDTTYLESPELSGTSTSKRVRVVPMTTRSGYRFTERFSLSSAGSPTVYFRVYEGNTLREQFPVAGLTTTPTTFTFDLTNPGAVGDAGNLFAELAGTA